MVGMTHTLIYLTIFAIAESRACPWHPRMVNITRTLPTDYVWEPRR